MLSTQTKTQTQVSQTTVIAASLILATSSVALFLSWGMMAGISISQISLQATKNPVLVASGTVQCSPVGIPAFGRRKVSGDFSFGKMSEKYTILKSKAKFIQLAQSSTSQKVSSDIKVQVDSNVFKDFHKNFTLLARMKPKEALKFILTKQDIASLNSVQKDCLPQPEEGNATVSIMHADFFDRGKTEERIIFRTQTGKEYIAHVANPQEYLESGTMVRYKGFALNSGKELLVDTYSVVRQAGNPPVYGPQRVIAIIAQPNDLPLPKITKEEAVDLVFNQANSFYQKNSYSQMSLAGKNGMVGSTVDIYPASGAYPITLPYRCSQNESKICNPNDSASCLADEGQCQLSCNFNDITPQIISAASNDVVFEDGARVVIFFPEGIITQNEVNGCEWGGAGSIGKNEVTIKGQKMHLSFSIINGSNIGMTVHELGHNFGNHHASFLQCQSAGDSIEECLLGEGEYGDPYDVMGTAQDLYHGNAIMKENLGWLTAQGSYRIEEITQNGTYYLQPIGDQKEGLKAIKIPHGPEPSPMLSIEYRLPIDLDENIARWLEQKIVLSDVFEGALLHTGNTADNHSYLFDPTPTNNYQIDRHMSSLQFGSKYKDLNTGTEIEILDPTESAELPVKITLGRTDFEPPTNLSLMVADQPDDCSITYRADAVDSSGISGITFYLSKQFTTENNNADITKTFPGSPPFEFTVDKNSFERGYIWFKATDQASISGGSAPDTASYSDKLQIASEKICYNDSPTSVAVSMPFLETPIILNNREEKNFGDIPAPVHFTVTANDENLIKIVYIFELPSFDCLKEKDCRLICNNKPLYCKTCGASGCLLENYLKMSPDQQQVSLDVSIPMDLGKHYFSVHSEDSEGSPGDYYFTFNAVNPNFIRGNVNNDNAVNITDAIYILEYLFKDPTKTISCSDSADTNDDGLVNITDAIVLLRYLFADSPNEMKDPYLACGTDPTPNDNLVCASFPQCQ